MDRSSDVKPVLEIGLQQLGHLFSNCHTREQVSNAAAVGRGGILVRGCAVFLTCSSDCVAGEAPRDEVRDIETSHPRCVKSPACTSDHEKL